MEKQNNTNKIAPNPDSRDRSIPSHIKLSAKKLCKIAKQSNGSIAIDNLNSARGLLVDIKFLNPSKPVFTHAAQRMVWLASKTENQIFIPNLSSAHQFLSRLLGFQDTHECCVKASNERIYLKNNFMGLEQQVVPSFELSKPAKPVQVTIKKRRIVS